MPALSKPQAKKKAYYVVIVRGIGTGGKRCGLK